MLPLHVDLPMRFHSSTHYTSSESQEDYHQNPVYLEIGQRRKLVDRLGPGGSEAERSAQADYTAVSIQSGS